MIDESKIKKAVLLFLEGIGEDPTREGLIETPDRVARMAKEVYGGIHEDVSVHFDKTFYLDRSDMVIEKDIIFYSTCEHHLLPFYGTVDIGYLPDGKVAGLSKLARVVEAICRRPQIQERMTNQIGEAIYQYLKVKGVIVKVEAEHMCMSMRGIKKPGTKTITYACFGEFESDRELRDRFFNLVK